MIPFHEEIICATLRIIFGIRTSSGQGKKLSATKHLNPMALGSKMEVFQQIHSILKLTHQQ